MERVPRPDFGEIEMYANANTMRMPTNYVDMNADEIEYTGEGWFKWVGSFVIGGASAVAIAAVTGATLGLGTGVATFVIGGAAVDACAYIWEKDW